ncbi:hypothetical protein GCM10009592_27850 [Brachybacterium rhamnosum]
MEQRRSVRPPNWGQLAERLAVETEGAVVVKGDMLRKWLLAAEETRAGRRKHGVHEEARL